jgi:ABC-2 type transport system permease protein
MNMPSDAMAGAPPESQVLASAEIPPVQRIYWAFRRELWENRSIYLAPLTVAGVALFGFLLSLIRLPAKIRASSALDSMKQHQLIEQPYDVAAGLLMATFLLVALFYCVEALQRERRDRSILFWKSLPVSDFLTVAAKASIPFLVLPLFTVALTVVTQFIMLVVSSMLLAASGLSVANYWAQVSLFQTSFLLLYHVMTVHVLWSAPIYSWLLLVSAWARRAAFLWALLPPVVFCALEKLLFNTAHFAGFLEDKLSGAGLEAVTAPGTMPMNPMTHLTPGRFFGAAGLWIGFAVSVLFLAGAVRLRRYRGPN